MSIKVPALVACLMITVSALVSTLVLIRLSDLQQRSFDTLTSTYLDGATASISQHLLRDDVWEVYDGLDRSRPDFEGLAFIDAVVTRSDGTIVAATTPDLFPIDAAWQASSMDAAPGASTAWLRRDLNYQGRDLGAIWAGFDISGFEAERRSVLLTLIGLNALLTLILALGGWMLARRMLYPAEKLTTYLGDAAAGTLRTIPVNELEDPGSETGRLFRGYNAMASAVFEREELSARFAEEERLASLGRLASVVAHEINNPLGGLLNAVDTLKAHGARTDVREASLGLLERGLLGIRDVVGTTLALYRPDRNPRPLTALDLADIRLLVGGELRRKRLTLAWECAFDGAVSLASGSIRQIVLNLLLNACEATPDGGRLGLRAEIHDNAFCVTVRDGGLGFPPKIASMLTAIEPSDAPRVGDGLGLWTVRHLVRELDGHIRVHQDGEGSAITVEIPLSVASSEHVEDNAERIVDVA